ncbi:hypothetical protein AWZ03_012896 [Drosophila navojoa]|uniref:Uncharacterized protein n=1 Tax=Drosophila navojoa TaxID=7232 RepID=A0A484AW99_DRONA|nr:hypothetical protein AWZ03_012896 [Drosophila navojoa]
MKNKKKKQQQQEQQQQQQQQQQEQEHYQALRLPELPELSAPISHLPFSISHPSILSHNARIAFYWLTQRAQDEARWQDECRRLALLQLLNVAA